jgi:hypothetical protein
VIFYIDRRATQVQSLQKVYGDSDANPIGQARHLQNRVATADNYEDDYDTNPNLRQVTSSMVIFQP